MSPSHTWWKAFNPCCGLVIQIEPQCLFSELKEFSKNLSDNLKLTPFHPSGSLRTLTQKLDPPGSSAPNGHWNVKCGHQIIFVSFFYGVWKTVTWCQNDRFAPFLNFQRKKGYSSRSSFQFACFHWGKNRIKKLLFGDRMPYSTICSFHNELPLITRSCLASYISPKSYQGFACSENFLSLLKWFNQPSLAERPRTGSNRIPFSDEGSDARDSSDFVAEERQIK